MGNERSTLATSLLHAVIVIAHSLAAIGIMIIIYGIASKWTGEVWRPIEPYVRPTSIYLVLLGLLITSVSIYCPWEVPRPIHLSRFVTAPAAILLVCAGIYFETTNGLPESAVNGFALLTIAGAMLRMFPRPGAPRTTLPAE